jgi:hypothetical protein
MILGSNLGRDKRFFSFPKNPDLLWGPHSLLCIVYIPGFFPRIKAAGM